MTEQPIHPVPPRSPLPLQSREAHPNVALLASDQPEAVPDRMPAGHPARPDAAEIRRATWRRRPNVRTTFFRPGRRVAEIRT